MSKGGCRRVTLQKTKLPENGDKENGTKAGSDVTVAAVQMSSVEGARFLADALNAAVDAMVAKSDKTTSTTSMKAMKAYVALPVGVDDSDMVASEPIDAEVIQKMQKVDEDMLRQHPALVKMSIRRGVPK